MQINCVKCRWTLVCWSCHHCCYCWRFWSSYGIRDVNESHNTPDLKKWISWIPRMQKLYSSQGTFRCGSSPASSDALNVDQRSQWTMCRHSAYDCLRVGWAFIAKRNYLYVSVSWWYSRWGSEPSKYDRQCCDVLLVSIVLWIIMLEAEEHGVLSDYFFGY